MQTRILIIEDHTANRELMAYLLEAFGYSTLTATDGVTGIEIAAREKPSLVICDIQMPGIDGYEVAKRMKQDAVLSKIPLLAITALAMVGDRDRVLAAGFDGYIGKPIAPETFVSEVESFLRLEERVRAHRAAASAGGPGRETKESPAVNASVAVRGTILVVDNVQANLELSRSIFEPSGYRVLLASDVATAIAMAHETTPDLVLSDVNMPEGTGFELAKQFSSDPQLNSVPVVLISATLPREVSGDQARAVGAAKFLRRPIDPGVLLKEIEDCIVARRGPRKDKASGDKPSG